MAYILGYVINNGNVPDVPEVNKPVINIQSSRIDLYTDQNLSVSVPLGVSIENPVDGVSPTFSATGLPAGLEIQNGYIVGAPNETGVGTATITISYPGAASKEIYVDYQVYAVWIRGTENDTTFDLTVGEEFGHQINWTLSNNGKVNFTIYDGKLPTGLKLSGDGIIYGTPTTVETCTCIIQINANGPFPAQFELTLHFNVIANTSTDKEYVYTVSGASTEYQAFNGDYYDTGELYSNKPIYKNDNNMLLAIYEYMNGPTWGLYNDKPGEIAPSIYETTYAAEPDADNASWLATGGLPEDNLKVTKVQSEKTYLYTVSNAGDSDANGDYWATGETVKVSTSFVDPNDRYNTIQKDTEYPIYTNGKYYIVPNEGVGQYIIDDAVTPNGAPNYRGPSLITGTLSGEVCIANTPADGSWEVLGGTAPAPTVTEYSGGGSDTPDDTDKIYVYTVTGAGSSEANGNYYDSGETVKTETDEESTQVNLPIYTNDVCKIYPSNGTYHWHIIRIADNQTLYTGPDFYESLVMPDGGSWSRVSQGVDPAPTVTEYAASDSDTPETGDKAYAYTVTTTSTEYADAAGDYYEISGKECDAKYPPDMPSCTDVFYINDNGYRLHYCEDIQICQLQKYYDVVDLMGDRLRGWDEISTTWAMGVDLPATGEWNNGFDVVAYSGGGNTPSDKEYELTVSDASGDHAGANGNYWRIDPPTNMWNGYNTTDYGVWTNGTYYIAYCTQYWMGWTIVNNIELDPSSGTDIRAAFVMASSAPAGSTPVMSWSDVTVTLYSGNKEYKYTITGFTGGKSAANGDYWQIEPAGIHSVYRTDLGVYTNGTYYLAYCNAYWTGWCLVTDITVDPAPMDGSDSLIAPGPSGDSPVMTWAMLGATVTEYAG